ncbi:hypothetical protein PV326_003496 [Microctonus aethiopoides]|nr:hypothetical protein PV326_003496 [Microctonus aethiopoides]
MRQSEYGGKCTLKCPVEKRPNELFQCERLRGSVVKKCVGNNEGNEKVELMEFCGMLRVYLIQPLNRLVQEQYRVHSRAHSRIVDRNKETWEGTKKEKTWVYCLKCNSTLKQTRWSLKIGECIIDGRKSALGSPANNNTTLEVSTDEYTSEGKE